MKTITALLLSTSLAFAGGLPTEFPAEAQVERPARLGSNADWLVPLLLIGVVAIAVSGHDEPKPCGEECSPPDCVSKACQMDTIFGVKDWKDAPKDAHAAIREYWREHGEHSGIDDQWGGFPEFWAEWM